MTRITFVGALVAAHVSVSLVSCYGGGERLEGLKRTPPGNSARVVWDLDAEHLPEIPFPNDSATRPDLDSATGRRVNASLDADTSFERELRGHLSNLDGWGTLAPMWVSFDAPLDLANIAQRQRADGEFDDDAVLLINVTKGSPAYGEALAIDFGSGSYPVTVEKPDRYLQNDPRDEASNLMVDSYDEDARGDGDGKCDEWEDSNQNGVLDPGEDLDEDGVLDVHEDTDDDGVCDVGNIWGTVERDPSKIPHHPQHPGCPDHPYHDLISFYEMETNTLTWRPLVPLRERTTYAVVLTTDLLGADGTPIGSPWEYVHHLQQTEALAPLLEDNLLGEFNRSADDIAFAWTFTTQSVTEGLVKLREGINGVGPFSHLEELYPPDLAELVPMSYGEGAEQWVLRPEDLVRVLELIFSNIDVSGLGADDIRPLLDTYGSVDYFVAGDFISPNFVDAGGGVFDIDPARGTGTHQPEKIRFMMAVPKAEFGPAPFPVLYYCHGFTSMKLEALAFSGLLAKHGVATFIIDAARHGIPLVSELEGLIDSLLAQYDAEDLKPFFDAVLEDRAIDLNSDGFKDPAGDFYTNNTFHTRDLVRQTLLDYLQAGRMFRSFDGTKKWDFDLTGDGTGTFIAGDFNNDGVVDAGGPNVPSYAAGTSMGGLHSSILGAIDPNIVASAPISPGGALLEVGLRTDLSNVIRAVVLPVLGPMIITEPFQGDERATVVKWLVNDVLNDRLVNIARVGDFEGGDVVNRLLPGDIMRVENLTNGVVDEVVVPASLRVRAHLASDIGDEVLITIWAPNGTGEPIEPGSHVRVDSELRKRIDTFEFEENGFYGRNYAIGQPLVAVQEGLGLRRNSPRMRRLLGISQMILDPADPGNWAPFYSDPLDIRPEGARSTNILFTVTMGDMTVPASSGITLARAAGVVGYLEPNPIYGVSDNQLLIDRHVTEGIDELHYFDYDCCYANCGQVNFDIDDLSNGNHPNDIPRLTQTVSQPLSCFDDSVSCAGAVCEPLPPLRLKVRNGNGWNAVRFPALDPQGQHAIDIPDPNRPFDASTFSVNQMGLFLSSGGTVLSDHPCLAKNDCRPCAGEPDCPSMPPPTVIGVQP